MVFSYKSKESPRDFMNKFARVFCVICFSMLFLSPISNAMEGIRIHSPTKKQHSVLYIAVKKSDDSFYKLRHSVPTDESLRTLFEDALRDVNNAIKALKKEESDLPKSSSSKVSKQRSSLERNIRLMIERMCCFSSSGIDAAAKDGIFSEELSLKLKEFLGTHF